jgi:hypothetical protein
MKKLTLVAAIAALLPSAALAETFASSVMENPGAVSVGTTGPDGRVMQGRYWTGSSDVTWGDGKKSKETFTCISNTQPPNDAIFMMHGTCDSTGSEGSYTSIWGCNILNAATGEITCVGGVYGKTGKFAKRGGTMTYHGANGKGTATGQLFP